MSRQIRQLGLKCDFAQSGRCNNTLPNSKLKLIRIGRLIIDWIKRSASTPPRLSIDGSTSASFSEDSPMVVKIVH